MLAVALLGFLLLINLLGTLTSTGPDDLLAATPSEERYVGLPSGVGMFAFAIGAVGLILAAISAAAMVVLARREDHARTRLYLAVGAVIALLLAGAGLYLSLSGVLSEDMAYDQHQALRPYVEPKGLAVLGAFFLSFVVIGILKPKFLLAHLAVWLVLALIFGFFASDNLAGLNLFEEKGDLEAREAYAAEVEKYRRPKEAIENPETVHWDSKLSLSNGNAVYFGKSSLLLEPGTSSVSGVAGSTIPLFTVTGAENTSLLRSATGDVYENGEWVQLDPASFQSEPWVDLPRGILDMIDEGLLDERLIEEALGRADVLERAVPDLLAQPSAVPDSFTVDHISVSPTEGFEMLEAGTLPISSIPLGIGEGGSWNPFSRTFRSDAALDGYEWQALAPEYAEEQLAAARPVDDATYYRLPETLPQRVRDLAGEVTQGLDSPYRKAGAIEQFLESEYTYSETHLGQQPPSAPEGHDPADWFLFERGTGGASSFSTAFTVLARAAGVPTRVVSGWVISPTGEKQTVHSDQAHQWAEIGLERFGWIPFDPTPGGTPERVSARNSQPVPGGSDSGAPTVQGTPDGSGGGGLAGQGSSSGSGNGTPAGQAGEGGAPGGSSEARQDLTAAKEEIALRNLSTALNPEIRQQAAEILGEIGSDRAIQTLVNAMFNDTDGNVREVSIDSLATQDVGKLEGILQHNPDPQLRTAAALALGSKGDPEALSALSNSLIGEPDASEGVRLAAASALGQLQLPEAVEPLAQALASDEDEDIREAAASALGELQQPEAVEPLAQALASDEDEDVRAAAADSLGELPSPSALPPLLEARSNDPSPTVRGTSDDALDEFDQQELGQALKEDDDPSVRAAAAQVLGEQNDPSAVDDLVNALHDGDEDVRETAKEAVSQLGSETPLENGSSLLSHAEGTSFIPGTTTGQSVGLPHVPVFEIEGAAGVNFLRIAVGDRYESGQWLADQQPSFQYAVGSAVPDLGVVAQATAPAASTLNIQATVYPPSGEEWISQGSVPIASQPISLSLSGTLFPPSETFTSGNRVPTYSWTSGIPVYSEQQVQQAAPSPHYAHTSVPSNFPPEVRALALRITSGQTSTYRKAKAIEQYLKSNYTYRLADPSHGGVPQGRDPVDWFLFESREGTCGNFSSAFVILARSVGIPARVVSGWSISPTEGRQTVYADQAHQRAEVAFEGMGWVPFEPTASGAAPDRTEQANQGPRGDSQQERQEIEELVEQLSEGRPEEQTQAREELEQAGAEITETENGGAVVTQDGESFSIGTGTTTQQVADPGTRDGGIKSVFFVTGAGHTPYLRSAVGDLYENGQWSQMDRVSLDYDANQSIPHLVRNELAGHGTGFTAGGPTTPALLNGFEIDPPITYTDSIVIEASPGLGNFPYGVVPTSQFLDQVDQDGQFHPVSGTYSLDQPTESFSWVSRIPQFTSSQLQEAQVAADGIYTQLPEGLPERIRSLALDVTSGHSTPYAKARALEQYLNSQYTYRFADGSGSEAPPPGRDPVDWFLFDHREGTCGVFSTAFVVMARSIGIPARVASGWAISPSSQRQEVLTDQAHQWAEVAFAGLGWVQFEPTASLGAPSRTELAREQPQQVQEPVGDSEQQPAAEEPATAQEQAVEDEQGQEPASAQEQAIEDDQGQEAATGQEQAVEDEPGQEPATAQEQAIEDEPGQEPATTQEQAMEEETEQPASATEDASQNLDQPPATEDKTGEEPETPQEQDAVEEAGQQSSVSEKPAPATRQEQIIEPMETVTEITLWPERVRRRIPFTIGGTVRTTRGGQVSDVRVEIFINETKDHGGILIGETTSRLGRFTAEATVPSSLERGSYQILAHAVANEQYTESWSDPDLTVYSESGLQLTGPSEISVDTQAFFHGKLLDDTGSGVPGLEVQIEIDGRSLPSQSTNAAGEFAFSQTFAEIGSHTVEVGTEGRDFLLGNTARMEVQAVMPTELTVNVPGDARVGEDFPIEGFLMDARGRAIPEAVITFMVGDSPTWSATTGANGEFQTIGAIDAVGHSIVRSEYGGEYPVLPSAHSTTVSARFLTEMTVYGPSSVAQGEPALFRGRITSRSVSDIGSLQIVIEDEAGVGIDSVMTDDDGSFRYSSPGVDEPGPSVLTARFNEQDELTSSSASFSYSVVAPTVLTVSGPSVAAAQGTVELAGALTTVDGQPVPGAPVWVGDPGSQPLITDADGAFSRQFPLEFHSEENETESMVNISFGYEGTDSLAPSLRNHSITVGLPWIFAEPTEPAARGETATVRGTVFIGSRPVADAVVNAGDDLEVVTNATGAFILRYPVDRDTSLGRLEIPLAVASLNLQTMVPLDVKSSVNLFVAPMGDVQPGREAILQATLLDDEGQGIPGATLRTSEGDPIVTGAEGTAQLPLEVPDDEGSLVVPVSFTYEGDALYLPLTYSTVIPLTQTGFNWLLWAGLPAVIVAILASGFIARASNLFARTGGYRPESTPPQEAATAVADGMPDDDAGLEEFEPVPLPDPEPTFLEVTLEKPAPDLPEVWGPGEQVTVNVGLYAEDGIAIPGATVGLRLPNGETVSLLTGADGRASFSWRAETVGDLAFTAEFAGAELHLPATSSVDFRVVEFREEIVALYNSFVAWAVDRVPGSAGRTPRELESVLTLSGIDLDFRVLDVIITRFEEADYSEHEIGRRQYEAMYRAWYAMTGEPEPEELEATEPSMSTEELGFDR